MQFLSNRVEITRINRIPRYKANLLVLAIIENILMRPICQTVPILYGNDRQNLSRVLDLGNRYL